jgi:hypothetical protein
MRYVQLVPRHSKPKTLAIMHGSSFTGDCAQALDDLNVMLHEVFGPQK